MKAAFLSLLTCGALAGAAHAQILVGLDPVVDTGGPDGWSGISVLTTPITAPASTSPNATVTNFNYWDDRGSGNHDVIPLIVQNSGGTFSIIGIGTQQTASIVGAQSAAFGLVSGVSTVDTSTPGITYHAAVFQRDLTSAENTNDGTIPFGASGGAGMFQMDVTDNYSPTVGDPVTSGFASGPGGRNYAFNFEYVVPEPGAFSLLGVAGLMAILRRRRR